MFANDGPLKRLPLELRLMIRDYVDFPLDFEKAKELRRELMEERKEYDISYRKDFQAYQISLCEH